MRRDIQGLRAVAVLAVVGDHLVGRPSGGFAGVDVFFVISGFLITGLLLREHRRTGRIDLLSFYRRRIKRTVPVALVVIAATLVAGGLVLSSYAFAQLAQAALPAATFWSNWQLIAVGTDYLHATDTPVALQHYWSLAVEEQFYLVWPAVLIAAFAVRARTRVSAPTLVLGAIAVSSLVWAAVETASHPTAAYFSTATRAWELLAGAALAFAASRIERVAVPHRSLLRWGGLILLVGSLFVVSPDSPFPFPWAVPAVLGTVLVIAAGIGDEEASIVPLTNPVSQYIGRISYSVYLWHFPVVVLAKVFHPDAGIIVSLLELVLTLVLSVLSYHLVEQPLRRASWSRFSLPRPTMRGVLTSIAGVVVVVSIGALLVASRQPPTLRAVSTLGYFPASPSALQIERTQQIDAALGATSWPSVTPTDAQLRGDARVDELLKDGCLLGYTVPMTAQHCVFGETDGPRTAVLYGDSIALSWAPAVRAALAGRGWRVEVLTRMQCPAITISVDLNDGEPNSSCDAFHRSAMKRIEAEHPALVIMTSSHLSLNRLHSGAKGTAAAKQWTARTRATLQWMSNAAGHVVVLDAPPVGPPARNCKTPGSTPQDCTTSVALDWKQAATAQRRAVRGLAAENVLYPSTLPWFCRADGRCPPFVDGRMVLADGEHLTQVGAEQLGPLMREALQPAIGDTTGD